MLHLMGFLFLCIGRIHRLIDLFWFKVHHPEGICRQQ
jgi:hypothetical protein